jgi:hypothetical protein
MSLYSASAKDFIQTCQQGGIDVLLTHAFQKEHGHLPEQSEITSWRNSLPAIARVFAQAGFQDQWVLLEYKLPLASQRVDCVIAGHDGLGQAHVVLIELKQWTTEVCASSGSHEVRIGPNSNPKTVLHPCAQVHGYLEYLRESHTAFHTAIAPLQLSACSYLHNYPGYPLDPLTSGKFTGLLGICPLFDATQINALVTFLQRKVGHGAGGTIATLLNSRAYAPSKKLMAQLSGAINSLPQYILLDEQRIGFDVVLYAIQNALATAQKWVILVCGKPGSGKSVVAMKLFGTLLQSQRRAYYATGSKAFTETLKAQLHANCAPLLRYTNQFSKVQSSQFDVVIVVEAHRIRQYSTNGQGQAVSNQSQLAELFQATKVLVLFADDGQAVKPDEIGSINYLRHHAQQLTPHFREFELKAQFRCGGASTFVDWIDNTLGVQQTATTQWIPNPDFEFKIASTPCELESWILSHVENGATGRLTAGFCWPWSPPNSSGNLVSDIKIGTFSKPWNASPKATFLAPGIPTASLWATDPAGVHQVGCIYSAQGFEFDYVGVIVGGDLRHDPVRNQWVSDRTKSYDSQIKYHAQFQMFVRNVYRVLLTRGMKGCYVYFEDKATETYFRNCISMQSPALPQGN